MSSSRWRSIIVTLSTLLVALLLMGAVMARNTNNEGAYRQLGVYTDVLQRIKTDYVEEPDLKSVTLGAVNGLLEAIDPFASYLNADQYKEYLKSTGANSKGDVGLLLSKRFGYLGVVDVVPNSPAAKAGLTTGDMIESIRGIATRDMPLAYANLLLAGKPGTPIEVAVLAMRHPEPRKITLTRTTIEYPRVASKMLKDQIGYVQVQAMLPGTANEISRAVKQLESQGAKKLMLDMRYCGEGSPEEGIAVANLFQNDGLITYLQGQRSPRQDFKADPTKAITKLPLIVLTNRGTASGAEVAAASLLDSKRADVVGERSYGDASVRQAIRMDDGGAIILSVAKYYSPSGKAIQDNGVAPTVQVAEAEPIPADIDEEEGPAEAAPAPEKQPGEDPILKKALEVAERGAAAVSQDQTPQPAQENSPRQPQAMPPNVVPNTPNHVPQSPQK